MNLICEYVEFNTDICLEYIIFLLKTYLYHQTPLVDFYFWMKLVFFYVEKNPMDLNTPW